VKVSNVLVTGAGGFTGRYLVAALAEAGHTVHALVSGGKAIGDLKSSHDVRYRECDLLRPEQIAEVVDDIKPDKVAHLAAIAFVGHGDVETIYRTNIVGTRNLLHALARLEAPVSNALLVSSANVYGNASQGRIDENSPTAPANDYAVSKLGMEYMAALWKSSVRMTIVRPFNYTGVGQSTDFLIPKIVAHFKKRSPTLELGNLDVERDFSDVRTVTQAYVRLLALEGSGSTYNVCSGRGYSLGEVLSMAERIHSYRPEISVNPRFVRTNEVKTLVGSKNRLEKAIGPLSGPELEETLEWMSS
jgi:GDP-6-deoxy-D-talose 4-dehydrogenase